MMRLVSFFTACLLVHSARALSFLRDYAPEAKDEGADEFIVENTNNHIVEVDAPNGGKAKIRDGDIAMMDDTANILGLIPNTNTKRGAMNSISKKWPGAKVVYLISDDLLQYSVPHLVKSTKANSAIKAAMAEIESKSCIKFVPKTNEANYVNIVDKTGCYSYVGRIGGAQDLSLGPGCWIKRIAIHELLHAIGFLHEQSRPDRDSYVQVLYDNIQAGKESQFTKYDATAINSLGETYDYVSVMHYRNKDYAKDRSKNTLQKINDPNFKLGRYDNEDGMSKGDAVQLKLLYACSATTPPTTASSTAAPTTASSTAAPTTASSTAAPTTAVSTAAPTTAVSTAASTTSSSTVAPTTTTTTTKTKTTTTTTTTTKKPRRRCGVWCIIRRILRRIARRRRRQRQQRRRRYWGGRRRHSWGGGWGWGKKDETVDKKDGKSDENDKDDTEVTEEKKDDSNEKPLTKLDEVLAELEEDEDTSHDKMAAADSTKDNKIEDLDSDPEYQDDKLEDVVLSPNIREEAENLLKKISDGSMSNEELTRLIKDETLEKR